MRTLLTSHLGIIVALTFAGAAYGQVPASNDTSDTRNNTGVGTQALGGPAASNAGEANTAVGWSALLTTLVTRTPPLD